MSVNWSDKLNEHFDNNIDLSKTLEHFDKLKWMDLDPAILEHFENKILWIIEANPEVKDIVDSTLDKTTIQLEMVQSSYSEAFWDILNNPDYTESDEDESFVA